VVLGKIYSLHRYSNTYYYNSWHFWIGSRVSPVLGAPWSLVLPVCGIADNVVCCTRSLRLARWLHRLSQQRRRTQLRQSICNLFLRSNINWFLSMLLIIILIDVVHIVTFNGVPLNITWLISIEHKVFIVFYNVDAKLCQVRRWPDLYRTLPWHVPSKTSGCGWARYGKTRARRGYGWAPNHGST